MLSLKLELKLKPQLKLTGEHEVRMAVPIYGFL